MPLAGDVVGALDFPETVQAVETTTITDITTTTFVAGSPTCDVDFVAPSSGRVVVTVGGGTRDQNIQGNRVALSARVTNNTGTPAFVEGPGTRQYSFSSLVGAGNYVYGTRSILIEGLEPGGSYNASVRYRVTGGSNCDIDVRQILVQPAQ